MLRENSILELGTLRDMQDLMGDLEIVKYTLMDNEDYMCGVK